MVIYMPYGSFLREYWEIEWRHIGEEGIHLIFCVLYSAFLFTSSSELSNYVKHNTIILINKKKVLSHSKNIRVRISFPRHQRAHPRLYRLVVSF